MYTQYKHVRTCTFTNRYVQIPTKKANTHLAQLHTHTVFRGT